MWFIFRKQSGYKLHISVSYNLFIGIVCMTMFNCTFSMRSSEEIVHPSVKSWPIPVNNIFLEWFKQYILLSTQLFHFYFFLILTPQGSIHALRQCTMMYGRAQKKATINETKMRIIPQIKNSNGLQAIVNFSLHSSLTEYEQNKDKRSLGSLFVMTHCQSEI